MLTEEKIDLVISQENENEFKVKTSTKGIRLEVTAKRTGSNEFALSGRGAKKYKEQIIETLLKDYSLSNDKEEKIQTDTEEQESPNAVSVTKGENESSSVNEELNTSIIIKENKLLGYDICVGSFTCTAAVKRGDTNSSFGWKGYELKGLEQFPSDEAVALEERILKAIEDYREKHDLHPLNILHGKALPKDGEMVRVISNMFVTKQDSGERDVYPVKNKYIGAEAKVKKSSHSFLDGSVYELEFLEEEFQSMYVSESKFPFHEKELLVI